MNSAESGCIWGEFQGNKLYIFKSRPGNKGRERPMFEDLPGENRLD